MSRPRKQKVDWFPHSVKHGKTMHIIEQKYGEHGYCFFYKLLEILGDTEGHYLDCNNKESWDYLLAKTNTTPGEAIHILETLASINVIDRELWTKMWIWCQSFVDKVSAVYKNRRTVVPEKPITTSRNEITTSRNEPKSFKNDLPTCRKPQSREKYIDLHRKEGILKNQVLKSNIMDMTTKMIFKKWNELKIVVHKNLKEFEPHIKARLDAGYTPKELIESMTNFAEIFRNYRYWWDTQWEA